MDIQNRRTLCWRPSAFGPPPGPLTSFRPATPWSPLSASTRPLGVDSPMSFLPSACVFFLLFLVNPLSPAIAKASVREQAVRGTLSSHRMSLLLPHPSHPHHTQLRSPGTRPGPWTQVTVGGLINHNGTGRVLAGPGSATGRALMVGR